MLLFVYLLLFFLKELSAVAGQPIIDVDCYNSKNNGSTFVGAVTETDTKTTCLNWKYLNSAYVHFHEDNNFCRNPNNFTKPWCYTDANTFAYGFCNISVCDSVCVDTFNKGSTYSGTIHTVYDRNHQIRQCVTWKSATYQHHLRENHNYCRNPDDSDKPWCFINSNINEWYYCNVPNCRKQVVTCLPLTSPQFDVVTNSPKHYLNDKVTLRCKSGYKGLDTIATCSATTTWSYQMPTCNPVNCKYLHLDSHVKSSNNMPKFNDLVTLSCEDGYLGNPVNIKCDIFGNWPYERPKCTARTCNILTVDVQVMKSENITKYNDNITLSCKEGYNGKPMLIKCYANGVWPSQRPNCTALPCPSLKLPMHSLNKDIKESQMYYVDQNVDFKCEKGYNLIGNGTYKCTVKGNSSVVDWNYEDAQTCLEKSKSCKDYMDKRCSCMSYGLCGGTLAVFVAISAGVHIATCFYFRKREGKSATVYEDMQFKTVERQNGSNDETYTELT